MSDSWCLHSPESEFPLNELRELVRPSASGFDDFGSRVDQMVPDEVQARFDVRILKLDEVQTRSDLFLHRYLIQLVTGSLETETQRRERVNASLYIQLRTSPLPEGEHWHFIFTKV